MVFFFFTDALAQLNIINKICACFLVYFSKSWRQSRSSVERGIPCSKSIWNGCLFSREGIEVRNESYFLLPSSRVSSAAHIFSFPSILERHIT